MIGEKLGSFRIESVLGSGAMGVVYRGVNETTGRLAAVKVISGEASQKNKAYERFRREAEILQQFRHPNIVRFLAVGRYKGISYFAMEFVPGETLDEILRKRGTLPWREVVDLGIQVCDALHYAHEHGVVHRDLKPSNLMISGSGQLKLTDFGIAKDLDATALTGTGRTLGTAAYMAPEQIRGTPDVSHKTDLYALGILFYQMLTGLPPFEGSSAVVLMHCHLNEPPPKPSDKTAEIPVELDDLITRLMAKSPNDRPWDAAAVAHSLRELRDKVDRGEKVAMVWPTEGDAAHPARAGLETPRKAKKTTKSRRKAPALDVPARAWVETGLLVVALVAVGGFIGYWLWPPSKSYLFHQAEILMASKLRHDWLEARDNYLDPLDHRFPDNPYRATTRAWRNRILLDEAQGRAKLLASPVHTSLSEPKNNGETQFVNFNAEAEDRIRRGEDLAAALVWDEMAKQLKPDDPEEGKWHLYALSRAEELRKAVAERRDTVAKLIARAGAALREGRSRDARSIRDNLIERFGKYADVADLLQAVGFPPPSEEVSQPTLPAQPGSTPTFPAPASTDLQQKSEPSPRSPSP